MAVYRKFCKTFGATPVDHPVRQGTNDPAWGEGPVLCRDFELWSSTTAWAIVWEGGPYDWPQLFPGGGTDEEYGLRWPEVKLAANVWTEAITGYALGLYREG